MVWYGPLVEGPHGPQPAGPCAAHDERVVRCRQGAEAAACRLPLPPHGSYMTHGEMQNIWQWHRQQEQPPQQQDSTISHMPYVICHATHLQDALGGEVKGRCGAARVVAPVDRPLAVRVLGDDMTGRGADTRSATRVHAGAEGHRYTLCGRTKQEGLSTTAGRPGWTTPANNGLGTHMRLTSSIQPLGATPRHAGTCHRKHPRLPYWHAQTGAGSRSRARHACAACHRRLALGSIRLFISVRQPTCPAHPHAHVVHTRTAARTWL